MYKILLLTIIVGGFLFAGYWEDASKPIEKSDSVKNQFCLAEDTSDDNKLERRRRGGKGNKGRKRGGNGLR
jgi:hypothetical protein